MYSFLKVNELLRFYSSPLSLNLPEIKKFGEMYFELHASQVDELIMWLNGMRKRYNEGERIFSVEGQNLPIMELTQFIISCFC